MYDWDRLSLRSKLTFWKVSLLTLFHVFGGTFLYKFLSYSLMQRVDLTLREKLDNFQTAFVNQNGKMVFHQESERRLESSTDYCPTGIVFEAKDASGKILLKSDNLEQYDLTLSSKFNAALNQGGVILETTPPLGKYPMRVAGLKVFLNHSSVYYLQVGMSLRDNYIMLKKFLLVFSIASIFIIVAGTFVGLSLIGKALKPVDELTQQARAITIMKLDQHLPLIPFNDEIGRLSQTFDDMLSRLDKSAKQIKQFTADAAHELKTPLTIIRGEIETTLSQRRTSEEYEQTLRNLLEESMRMSRIVEDLLTLSWADAGENKMDFRKVHLSELIQEIFEDAKALALAKNQSVFLERITPVDTLGDKTRLRQLFLNLIDNAIKYTDPGGHIYLSLYKNGNFVKVDIRDNGIGIPKDDLPRVFERFFRVDRNRSRQTGGTGLGLSICRWIAQAHHGTIDVKSALNEGTVFCVSLPSNGD